jgi:hypothetical protein
LRDRAGKEACSAQVTMISVYGIEDDLTILFKYSLNFD